MRIDLGMRVQDVVTGFEGMVLGHARYLTGCDQYLVQPEPKEEDLGKKRPTAEWYDDNRLAVMEEGALQPAAKKIQEISAGEANDGGADLEAPVK